MSGEQPAVVNTVTEQPKVEQPVVQPEVATPVNKLDNPETKLELIRSGVAKLNEFAKKGVGAQLTIEEQAAVTSAPVGCITRIGVEKYGEIYSVQDVSKLEEARKKLADMLETFNKQKEEFKNAAIADIRKLEEAIMPTVEKRSELLAQADFLNQVMQATKSQILKKIVELRSMGFDGIDSSIVKVKTLSELQKEYGFTGSWDEYLKLYNSGLLKERDSYQIKIAGHLRVEQQKTEQPKVEEKKP